MGNKKISHFCHISPQFNKSYFDLFNLLDLHIHGIHSNNRLGVIRMRLVVRMTSSCYNKQKCQNAMTLRRPISLNHWWHQEIEGISCSA